MARQERVRLVDDLDGSDAAETVMFGVDGRFYELDLTAEHASELRTLLAPYVQAGRGQPGSTRRPPDARLAHRRSTPTPNMGTDNVAIREWARGHGLTVSRRGRVPDRIRRAYAEQKDTGVQAGDPFAASSRGYSQPGLPPVTDPFAVPSAG